MDVHGRVISRMADMRLPRSKESNDPDPKFEMLQDPDQNLEGIDDMLQYKPAQTPFKADRTTCPGAHADSLRNRKRVMNLPTLKDSKTLTLKDSKTLPSVWTV